MVKSGPLLNAIILAGAVWSLEANATVLLDGTFGDGTFGAYKLLAANGVSGSGATYANGIDGHLSLVPDPKDPSRMVMATTRLVSDAKIGGGYRSEVSAESDPIGSERWYAGGFYLPTGWNPGGSEVILMQIQATPDTDESEYRSPTIKVSYQNGTVSVTNSYDYKAVTGTPGTTSQAGIDFTRRTLASWPVTFDQWIYLDIHAVWAGDDSGSLQIWKSGQSVFSEQDHINTFNDQRGVYFKAGSYAFPSVEWNSLTHYFSGVKIGDGSESLQSMTMVPEPSEMVLMVIGGLFLSSVVLRKRV